MKKMICFLLTVVMLMAVVPAAFAAEDTEILADETVTLKTASESEYAIFSYYAGAVDGIITLTMHAANPGWCYQVVYPDGTEGILKTGKDETTVEFECRAGEIISFYLGCYDKVGWTEADGTISYKVTFTPAEIEETIEYQDYAISDTMLKVGVNVLTMEANAYLTAFEFAPSEVGTYKVSAFIPTDLELCNYNTSTFPFNITVSNGDTMTNTVEVTITAVGQSVLIGVNNPDLTLNQIMLSVAKVSDYAETVINEEVYENKATVSQFAIPEGFTAGEYVDIYGDTVHTAVLGEDGYYHLDSADGDILLVDMNYIADLDGALSSDRPVMTVSVTEEDGSQTKYDISAAVAAYIDAADENEYYPLTEDLMFFYQTYGVSQGWYMEGASIFTETVTVETDEGISETTTEQKDFNADCAWMFACITMVAEEETGDETDPTESTTDATTTEGTDATTDATTDGATDTATGVITPETVTPETGDTLGSIIAVTALSALCIAALPVVKKKFF